jgi:hypothetical protein
MMFHRPVARWFAMSMRMPSAFCDIEQYAGFGSSLSIKAGRSAPTCWLDEDDIAG